jgi:molecular chaperone GrpE
MVQQNNETPDINQPIEGTEEKPDLQADLARCKTQAEANLAGWQRTQADFINYKRRSEQEKEEIAKFGSAALVLKILPVLDDFERAVRSLPEDRVKDPWVEGFRLVEKKLRTILETQGLSPIKAVGEVFDPRLHEAIRQDAGKEGVILQEMERGYKFQDRVIRPSKVVVGNGEETSSTENATEIDTEDES